MFYFFLLNFKSFVFSFCFFIFLFIFGYGELNNGPCRAISRSHTCIGILINRMLFKNRSFKLQHEKPYAMFEWAVCAGWWQVHIRFLTITTTTAESKKTSPNRVTHTHTAQIKLNQNFNYFASKCFVSHFYMRFLICHKKYIHHSNDLNYALL